MFFSRHITRNTLTHGQTEFVLAGSLKRKNDTTRCYYNLLCRYELRRQDWDLYLKRPTLPFLYITCLSFSVFNKFICLSFVLTVRVNLICFQGQN